jgi:DNA-binding transcriptional regulator YiaG
MKLKNKIKKIETLAASIGGASATWLLAMYRVRMEMGLNQGKFAAVIGLSKDAVVSWECGRNEISASSALRMSARLGRNVFDGTLAPVSVSELVEPRVREYERQLRRRLGVGQVFQPTGSPVTGGAATFPVRGCELATGKSPEPADRNVCPTSP